jgi:hypothetical protein
MLNNLQALQDDVGTFFLPHRETNLNLFEIACLGKPELALQGELIHYLRTRNWFCVQEAGYRELLPGAIKASSANLDILVFDRSEHHFTPLCCIELKHFSANQGPPNILIAGLSADYKRPRPDKVPIMLIGIYTSIVAATNRPGPSGLHRFARAVCGPMKSTAFASTFKGWCGPRTNPPASPWMHTPTIVSASPNSLKSCFLHTGEQLSGTVEAFIGVPV